MTKETIVRADVPDDKNKRKELVVSGLESGVTVAIVRPGDDDFASLGSVTLLYNDNGTISGGEMRLFELKTPKDQDEAMSLAGKVKAVILGSSNWTVIPLENLIAKFRNSGTKVFACASDPGQAKLYLQTLEKGVDGIVIDV
jgi:3-dehydroquinate synthase II